MKICNICGSEFVSTAGHLTCSPCRARKTQKMCVCGKMMHRQSSICKKCAQDDRIGEGNGNWRGGISKEKSRYRKNFQKKYPEKARAHRRVRYLLDIGILKRLPCERCNTEVDVHAHHDDYNKTDNVKWLCRAHHRERHLEIGKPMGRASTPL